MNAGTAPATGPKSLPTNLTLPSSQQKFAELPEEDRRQRLALFDSHKGQTWSDIQSSSDDYDRSLLTLSSGALAFSLAFIKDVVPLKNAVHPAMLFCSWIAFALSILSTLVSFRLSISAQEQHLDYARQYYLECDEQAANRLCWQFKALRVCNYASGAMFLAGFVLTIWFAILNVVLVVRK